MLDIIPIGMIIFLHTKRYNIMLGEIKMSDQPNERQEQTQQQEYVQQPVPQTVYVVNQPYAAPKPTASPKVKEAAFSVGSSVFMLIVCIVGTINLISGIIGRFMTFNFIGGVVSFVLELLMVIGMWITFAYAKKKTLSTKGISLIKVPYTIQFVFSVFAFVGNLAIGLLTLRILNLLIGIITFVLQCICFSSVNKTLSLARDINSDKPVAGRKAGSFAAIMMIISSVFTFGNEIIASLTAGAIIKAFEQAGLPKELLNVLGGAGSIAMIIAAVAFLVSISGAIVMLQFGKKVKIANEE